MPDSTAFVPAVQQPDPLDPAAIAALTFLGQYTNRNTRLAYKKDLDLFFAWCWQHRLNPLQAKRMHLQAYVVHQVETCGRSPKTVQRRIGTVSGFYACAVVDGLIEHSPTQHLKLPRVHWDDAKRPWLNRWELGALMRAAQESRQPADWALVTLLGTLGMRVTATCEVQIEDITADASGYRWLHTIGKGGKPSMKVLPIPTWKPIERAAAGRRTGPLLLRRDGTQMTRRSAARVVNRLAGDAGIHKDVTPHALRRSFATLALAAGVPIHVVQAGLDHSSSRSTLVYNRADVDPNSAASNTIAALLASTG